MNKITWIDFWQNAECELYGFEDAIFNSHFYGLEPVKTTKQGFFDHIEDIKTRLKVEPGDSLFEVGCGCGIILYPFYQNGHTVGGIDLSKTYLDISTKLMPEGNFIHGEAIEVDDSACYDFVLSCACAIYFPNFDYFEKVVEKSLIKARKGVYFAQLNNEHEKEAYNRVNAEAEAESEWHEFMVSSDNPDILACNEFYENADRLFFSEEKIYELGKRLGVSVEISPQSIPNRAREYRFDVLFSHIK